MATDASPATRDIRLLLCSSNFNPKVALHAVVVVVVVVMQSIVRGHAPVRLDRAITSGGGKKKKKMIVHTVHTTAESNPVTPQTKKKKVRSAYVRITIDIIC